MGLIQLKHGEQEAIVEEGSEAFHAYTTAGYTSVAEVERNEDGTYKTVRELGVAAPPAETTTTATTTTSPPPPPANEGKTKTEGKA